jgi:acetylornithine deacetylase/succinyl-diaminopimelate desuccinylase-like protein
MVLLLLKRLKVPLKRDVIFAATADEEIGGADGCGISWVIQHHPDLLRAEFGLTELGGYNVEFNGRALYPIQVAEKGVCWIKLRVRGQPGHGSQPHTNNAVVHLARAIDRIATHGLPYHLTEAAAGFLDAASQAVDEATRTALQQLKSAEGAQAMLNGALSQHPYWPMLNAILHNTAAPTGLSAGYKANVIPGVAEATLDGRLLPGFDAEMFLEEVQQVVAPLGPNFELDVILTSPPVQTPIATPLFETMARALQRHDPAGQPVPYMMSAATDAKHLARLGVPSYGFAPMKMLPGMKFMEMFHAHDERAPIEGLGWGVQVLFDVVQEHCGG